MKTSTATLLCALGVLVAACGRDSEVEIGVIEHFTEPNDVIEAPASATAGESTGIVVNTFGSSSCVSAEWTSVEYLSDSEVELTPYDRHVTEGDCTSDLAVHPHEEELVFSRPGTVTLRVIGRRIARVSGQLSDRLTEVEQTISVE